MDGDTVTLYVDGVAVGTTVVQPDGSYSVTIPSDTPLSDGTRAMTLTFTDSSGNESTLSPALSVVIDTVAPASPSVEAPIDEDGVIRAGEQTEVSISGTAEPNSTVDINFIDRAGSISAQTTVDGSGNWSLVGSELDISSLQDGPITVETTTTDSAGNVSSTNSLTTVKDSSGPRVGTAGPDTITGSDGNDIINGLSDDDVLDGGGGDDIINGGSDEDILSGGDGNDILNGGSQDDFIDGGDGDDLLTGGLGRDRLYGQAGRDRLRGSSGNDLLSGGLGDDLLWGGQGSDAFTYSNVDEFGDVIYDFEVVRDRIDLSTIFNGNARLGSNVIAQQVANHTSILANTGSGMEQVALLLNVNANTISNDNFNF